ncbi:MAG: hypothetical protein NVSMB62_24910 [Acidobacteriaceae bacterium]
MLESNDFSSYVVARLQDFFRPNDRWFRGLWDVGAVLSLRELLEAAEAASTGVLSEGSVSWLASDLKEALKTDAGVPRWAMQDLLSCFKHPVQFHDAHWHSLVDLTEEINEGYLNRCADAIEEAHRKGKPDSLRPERIARSVASHLLDTGFSPQFLAAWLEQQMRDGRVWSLLEILRELARLAQVPSIPYTVLILVSSGIRLSEVPDEWVQPAAAKKILRDAKLQHAALRYAGGWILEVRQRDAYSAAQDAFDEVDKRAARLLVGRDQRMTPLPTAYVFGEALPVVVPRDSIAQRVRIRSLERQKQLFSHQAASQIDAAIELLAQVDGSSAIAVAAGWAAIEALLAGPSGDKVFAADRLATLVTASFPRAELTALAGQQIRAGSPLAPALVAVRTNRERAQMVATEIAAGTLPAFSKWSDRAAVSRMQRLIPAARDGLNDIKGHVQRTLRRYYRQRNLVLHGGKTSPVALRACLRTGTPLLAAGVDRIAHAWFVNNISPLELAVRAQSRIDLASLPGRRITALLEGLPMTQTD